VPFVLPFSPDTSGGAEQRSSTYASSASTSSAAFRNFAPQNASIVRAGQARPANRVPFATAATSLLVLHPVLGSSLGRVAVTDVLTHGVVEGVPTGVVGVGADELVDSEVALDPVEKAGVGGGGDKLDLPTSTQACRVPGGAASISCRSPAGMRAQASRPHPRYDPRAPRDEARA